MEVFVAILLLFGAFSLGSATHEGMEGDPTTVEVPAAVNALPDGPDGVHASGDDVHASGDDDPAQLQDCMLNRHDVIYRDLSRARAREINVAAESAGDCDGACTDE